MSKVLTPEQTAITQQFQAHIDAEIRGDLDTTLSTMTSNPPMYGYEFHGYRHTCTRAFRRGQ